MPSCCKSRKKRGCKIDGHRQVSSEFKIFGKYAESAGLQSIICHILNIFIDDQVGILQIVWFCSKNSSYYLYGNTHIMQKFHLPPHRPMTWPLWKKNEKWFLLLLFRIHNMAKTNLKSKWKWMPGDKYYCSTKVYRYLKCPESASIEIPPFRPKFM